MNRERFVLSTSQVLVVLVVGATLITARPLLASAANNLAALGLTREWQTVSSDLDPPQCEERLVASTVGPHVARALSWDGKHDRSWLNAGRVAWLEGDCDQALAAWTTAHALDPRDEVTAFWLFWSAGGKGADVPGNTQPEDMARYARHAGERAQGVGRDDAALAWYRLSLELAPDWRALQRLAALYEQGGQMEAAIMACQEVAAALPEDDAGHWWAMGRAAELVKDWEGAAIGYARGADLAQEPYGFRVREGAVLQGLQDWSGAERAYEAALEAQPRTQTPYTQLAKIRRNQGDVDGALAWCRQAAEIMRDRPEPQACIGELLCQQGETTEARPYLERALQINPRHAGSTYALAQCLHANASQEEAVETLARAIEFHGGQPWQWAVELGDWRLEVGDREGALASYRLALSWQPAEEAIIDRLELVPDDGS